ncbi:MAG: hypothetical protein IJY62_03645 [Clostridia bacterium]|nr:hypothetical protein [Clostridia bacterium]
MKITELDKNFASEKAFGQEVVYLDSKNPCFALFGVSWDGERYVRLPKEVAEATNEGVKELYKHTSGGRVRFITDSPVIAIKARLPEHRMPHMADIGCTGFDILAEAGEKKEHFVLPNWGTQDEYASIAWLGERKKRHITLNFPLYNTVEDLKIGVSADAELLPARPYSVPEPVVYYGSSITQGGCAGRSGSSYTALLSEWFDCNYINLGFSGNGKGEQTMARYIAGLNMSVFVMDYDHNAPNAEHLEKTHEPFYKTIRAKHKNLPVIFISKPDFWGSEADIKRRDIIRRTYENAKKAGEKVWFLDGESIFGAHDWIERDACMIDRCHPNDLGMYLFATALKPLLKEALESRKK